MSTGRFYVRGQPVILDVFGWLDAAIKRARLDPIQPTGLDRMRIINAGGIKIPSR